MSTPRKPLLLFDGDCHFCRRWIERWKEITGSAVEYRTAQEASSEFPEIPPEDFERSVQWVDPSGHRESGAAAVLSALAAGPKIYALPLWLYRHVPFLAAFAEILYRFVASHRMAFSKATRLLWGTSALRPTFAISTRLFLRLLGLIYLVAIGSYWIQMPGLVGARGILPATEFFQQVHAVLGNGGFWQVPSVFWWNASEPFLADGCLAGMVVSVVLILGFAPIPCLLFLWVDYLSLTVAGQDFYQFQWDALLLEAGLLAVFLVPFVARLRRTTAPFRPAHFLLIWLLFRLMFSAGVVKLSSGDSSWYDGTALDFHYYTQPLPTVIGWYAHQMPGWFRHLSVAVMFAIELGVPFLLFAPRRLRHLGVGLLFFLQLLIALTGNYGFFNLLTLALCLLAIDDSLWQRFGLTTPPSTTPRRNWPPALAAVFVLLSLPPFLSIFRTPLPWLAPLDILYTEIAPFRSINGYGLFASMTKQRQEISIQGSDDDLHWETYRFVFKPNTAADCPRWALLYMPRLDWQMWFAALGSPQQNPWFSQLLVRLLEGSPPVLDLFKSNPFPAHPPRYIRAVLDDYQFTTLAEHRQTGDWWKVQPAGEYFPLSSLPGR